MRLFQVFSSRDRTCEVLMAGPSESSQPGYIFCSLDFKFSLFNDLFSSLVART